MANRRDIDKARVIDVGDMPAPKRVALARTCALWEDFLGLPQSARYTAWAEDANGVAYFKPVFYSYLRKFNEFKEQAEIGMRALNGVRKTLRTHNTEGYIDLGIVPEPLMALGLPPQRMRFNRSHVFSCLAKKGEGYKHPHNLSFSTLVRRLAALGEARIVCKSWHANGLTLIFDKYALENHVDWPIVAGILPYASASHNATLVASVYPMRNVVERMNHAIECGATKVYKTDEGMLDWMEQAYGTRIDPRWRKCSALDLSEIAAPIIEGQRQRELQHSKNPSRHQVNTETNNVVGRRHGR